MFWFLNFFKRHEVQVVKATPIVLKFEQQVVHLEKIPREYRDMFMKFIQNQYLEVLESIIIEQNDRQKIKKSDKGEGILMIWNYLKTLNVNEEQKVKMDEEKQKVKKIKEWSFLFG